MYFMITDTRTKEAMRRALTALIRERESLIQKRTKLDDEIRELDQHVAAIQAAIEDRKAPPADRSGAEVDGSLSSQVRVAMKDLGRTVRAADIASYLQSKGIQWKGGAGRISGDLSYMATKEHWCVRKVARGKYKYQPQE